MFAKTILTATALGLCLVGPVQAAEPVTLEFWEAHSVQEEDATKLMIAVAEGEESASSTEALASGFIALTGDLKAGSDAFRAKKTPEFSRS